MKRILETFDTFGIPLTLQISGKQRLFKSHLGGLFTLVIYVLSLLYIIFIFRQWQNNQIPPKMFSSSTTSTFEHLFTDYPLINVGFPINGDLSKLDPFSQQNNIITPILSIQYYNGTLVQKSLLTFLSDPISPNLGLTINIQSGINYYFPNGSQFDESDKTVLFVKCNPQFLLQNQTCAPDEVINKFFEQPANYLAICVVYVILDQDNQPTYNSNQYYLDIEKSMGKFFYIDFKTNIYSVNHNLIISDPTISEYITGSVSYCVSNTIDYMSQAYGTTTYGGLYLTLFSNQTQTTIQYSQIGELLASVGSIISMLLLLRYCVFEINTILLEKQILHQIIGFYYPQFQDLKIQYNLVHKIRSVQYKGQSIDLQKFKKVYNNLKRIAEEKLSFNNVIYEQSRLYMILRSIKSQSEIRRSHQMGIELIQAQGTIDSDRNINLDQCILDDNDFDLISLGQKNEIVELASDEPGIQCAPTFRVLLNQNFKI